MTEKKFFSLSLRQRIIWLTSGSVFVIGLILVTFVNLIAPIFITYEIGVPNTQILIDTTDENGNPITILAKTPGPDKGTIWHDSGFTDAEPLFIIRILSFLGLIFISSTGLMAARLVAKVSLQPVSKVSDTAKMISVKNLNARLNYQGEDDEIKSLADSFDRMLERLKTGFQNQNDFISNLAHELRTPLTSLRLNLEVLTENTHANLDDYREFAFVTERSLAKLEHLIEDLLLLAKAEKEIARQPILLGVMFEEILDELTPIAEENNVTLHMGGNIELMFNGDPVLLNRAIANLVENGIRYNHNGGYVRLSSHPNENTIIIKVQDNGIGITEKQQPHIFERFYRSESKNRSRKRNGNGLGLAITAQIIILHKGRIDVYSEVGKGSVFTITLPSNEEN